MTGGRPPMGLAMGSPPAGGFKAFGRALVGRQSECFASVKDLRSLCCGYL